MIQDASNIVFFLLAMMIALMVALNMEKKAELEQSSNTCGFETTIEYEHTKRLHEYHGTLSSYELKDGTWLFLREGEVCSLFDPLTRTDR